MNIEQARFNMVEQQIRPWDVLDQHVLDLLHKIHREDFVPPEHAALAFVDMEIPLGGGEAMWMPKLEARVVQEARSAAASTSGLVCKSIGSSSARSRAIRPRFSS